MLRAERHHLPRTLWTLACFLACPLLACFLACPLLDAQIVNRGISGGTDVTAYFSPANVMVGQQSNYTILVTNGVPDTPPPRSLSVPGLRLFYSRQSSRIEQTLSGPQRLTSYLYHVQPLKAGRFVAEERPFKVNGQEFTLPAARIRVRTPEELNITAEETKTGAFARVYAESTKAYTGQVIPVEITLYVEIRYSVSDWGYPDFDRDNFTIKRFERRFPVDTIINGRRYFTVSFFSIMSPLRAGSLPLGPATFNIKVRPSTRTTVRVGPGARPTVPRTRSITELKITSPMVPMEIRPLPGGDQGDVPVGMFSVNAAADPTTLTIGDPLELIVELRGFGNLDGIVFPELPETERDRWKVYQSTSEVRKTNAASPGGSVVLRRLMAPTELVKEVPSLQFRFFDPDSGGIKSVKTESIPLTVTENTETAEITDYGANRDALKPEETTDDILTLITDPPRSTAQLRPWTRTTGFRVLCAIPLLAIVGLYAFGAYHRWGLGWLTPRPVKRARYSDLARILQRGELSEKDFLNGYHAACQAWIMEKRQALPEPVAAALRSITERRDALNYAGAEAEDAMDRSKRAYLLNSLEHLS